MSDTLRSSLTHLRRRVRRATYAGALASHALGAVLAGGTLALLLRALVDVPPGRAAAGLLLVLLAPVTAWSRTRRRGLTAAEAATWLDVRTGGGGDLVTALERDDPRWRARAEAALARRPEAPRLRWKPVSARALAGLVFAALVLWVPVPARGDGPGPPLYRHRLADVREKLETLQEEIEFEEAERAELTRRLERIEAEAEGAENPEAMFESIAELGRTLEKEALEARDAVERAAHQLGDAARRAETDVAGARADLEETLRALDEQGLRPDLPADLARELADELGLDPDEARELGLEELALAGDLPLDADLLRGLSEEMRELLAEKLDALAEAGLLEELGELPAGELAELSDLGDLMEFDPEDLAEAELCEDCQAGEP